MDDHVEYLRENRLAWEELAAVHPTTDFYDVEGFLDGETTLLPLEREELGPLVDEGTTLLHLQCHFGLDTLSWAREGAEVVGVDFAETAVQTARELAVEAGLDDRAEFVQADVYDLPSKLDREFDVVFTSYGVLYWLPDVERWAEVVETFVAPGGTFYIAEVHPFTSVFGEDTTPRSPTFRYPYFAGVEPITDDEAGTYADRDAAVEHTRSHGWAHPMGEVVSALCATDLDVEFLHEYPWACFPALDAMEEDEEDRWWLPELEHDLPFTFSFRARMPE